VTIPSQPWCGKRRYIAAESNFCLVPLSQAPGSIQEVVPRFHSLIKASDQDAWVAGGAVRDAFLGEQPKDLDLYLDAAGTWEEALDALKRAGCVQQKDRPFLVELASPGGRKIDLIKRLADGMLGSIRSFDFVACCAAVSWDSFAFHRDFFAAAEARSLALSACPNATTTVRRALRFIARGWTMRREDAVALVRLASQHGPATDFSAPDPNDDGPRASEQITYNRRLLAACPE
jgi:Poly A polymerase head domain